MSNNMLFEENYERWWNSKDTREFLRQLYEVTKNPLFNVVEFQMLYLTRPHCNVKENFIERLVKNTQELKLPEKIESELLSRCLGAFKEKLYIRKTLMCEALTMMERIVSLGEFYEKKTHENILPTLEVAPTK